MNSQIARSTMLYVVSDNIKHCLELEFFGNIEMNFPMKEGIFDMN